MALAANTKTKGDMAEAVVIAELVKRGIPVSVPFGDNQRYDLIADIGGKLLKVQVKHSVYREGAIRFKARSIVSRRGGSVVTAGYSGDVDLFMVWCPSFPFEVYVVDVNVAAASEISFRVAPSRNGQKAGCRLAAESTLDAWLARD